MPSTDPPLRNSWLASDRPVPRLVARPIRSFLVTEAGGGVVLFVAAAAALVWANSPWSAGYDSLWSTEISLHIGSFSLAEDLKHWVNDGLMALFFFVVGLEIKRELVVGELSDRRAAALPVIAAVGGMVVPAALYASLNAGGDGSAGWGIPMATDIAFAVGLLALLGRRVPASLKIFLLSLAIADDIGAIVVIALFYSGGLSIGWLLGAAAALGAVVVLRWLRVWWTPIYVVVGAMAWLCTLESGVHATIAGVALGLLAPARPLDPEGASDVIDEVQRLADDPSPEELRAIRLQAQETVSVAERLEHLLHPWTSFAVIPIFALANAGVDLGGGAVGDAFTSPIALGIVLGLIAGKIAGITGASWVAVRMGWGTLPADVRFGHVFGVAAVAGIGFTVSLFIAELAFDDPATIDVAKIGILVASAGAALLGAVLLRAVRAPAR